MKKKIRTAAQVKSLFDRLAADIRKTVKEPRADWVFVGIQRRGVPLARRLSALLAAPGGPAAVGTLDITFYRDDSQAVPLHPVVHDTELPFDVTGKTVFIVDDVLFTGRTVRCALDELMDFGRPRRVYLGVLIDRGHRELPIQADFVGEALRTDCDETIDVHLRETDGEDAVWRSGRPEKPASKRKTEVAR
ncbi:MAG TPA: bifunctional pyr operon transcriptional regulator/uracil phosphoribosyltransferase PyrR [Elusimicrobiota bacterium]|nr:bifunctional pyr operon transcriptional regulator/uracil phosphoribosyltransferase PyrR [Elusimicrobiota bacterium]